MSTHDSHTRLLTQTDTQTPSLSSEPSHFAHTLVWLWQQAPLVLRQILTAHSRFPARHIRACLPAPPVVSPTPVSPLAPRRLGPLGRLSLVSSTGLDGGCGGLCRGEGRGGLAYTGICISVSRCGHGPVNVGLEVADEGLGVHDGRRGGTATTTSPAAQLHLAGAAHRCVLTHPGAPPILPVARFALPALVCLFRIDELHSSALPGRQGVQPLAVAALPCADGGDSWQAGSRGERGLGGRWGGFLNGL
mmetsp:Transcript_52419/g.131775  ORF Transcript_52419/g.131775 Transcript_52419/m.131775 type:complete len:248 (-) Transcript_52419:64-807(-)